MKCPKCNKGDMVVKSGRYGNFTACSNFPDCKNIYQLPFDFYIPHLRCCIEYDGKQHSEPLDFFGGLEAFEKLKINDKIKTEYCEENFVDLIRINVELALMEWGIRLIRLLF